MSCFSCGAVDCDTVLTWWKPPLHAATQGFLSPIIAGGNPKPFALSQEPLPNKFVLAFCGSGTGHLTQALKTVELLKERGMELAGIIADTDASQRMMDEMVAPLGVEVFTVPAITLVDGQKGMVPIPMVVVNTLRVQREMARREAEILSFFSRSRASLILTFWNVPIAYFLSKFELPRSLRVVHIAPQFAHGSLNVRELRTPIEVITKATVDVMADIFRRTGPCFPISSQSLPDSIPPILEVPAPVASMSPRLILCYFLVQHDARRLEQLIHKHPIPGVEFHCFTSVALTPPKDRPLSINSHPKQRALFQDLFARCSGVIVSTGNETIWEAVSRGVPVLTMPTADHGEQMLNAAIHARNFPVLVRARSSLAIEDVRWLTSFELSEDARAESAALRTRVASIGDGIGDVLRAPAAEVL